MMSYYGEYLMSLHGLSDTIDKANKANIKARDRVDISLEEYESMKKRIERLESDNQAYRDLFDKIKVPYMKTIDINSVQVLWSDGVGDVLGSPLKSRCRIEFDVFSGLY